MTLDERVEKAAQIRFEQLKQRSSSPEGFQPWDELREATRNGYRAAEEEIIRRTFPELFTDPPQLILLK